MKASLTIFLALLLSVAFSDFSFAEDGDCPGCENGGRVGSGPSADRQGQDRQGQGRKGKGRRGKGRKGGKLFAKFDKNKDGALTQDEVPERAWTRIVKADADGNGSVTRAELKTHAKKHGGKHRRGRRGGRGAGEGAGGSSD